MSLRCSTIPICSNCLFNPFIDKTWSLNKTLDGINLNDLFQFIIIEFELFIARHINRISANDDDVVDNNNDSDYYLDNGSL